MCLKLIFKVLYFLKMFPIFVGSVHDFGWTMTLFSEKILISNRLHKWFDVQLDQKILDGI